MVFGPSGDEVYILNEELEIYPNGRLFPEHELYRYYKGNIYIDRTRQEQFLEAYSTDNERNTKHIYKHSLECLWL